MSARLYNAAEALALLDGTTEGPWWFDGEFGFVVRVGEREAIVCSLDHECVVDPGREDGVLPDGDLLAAAPDLAASVEHHAARADAAERDRDALRAMIDGRTTPPTDAEIAVHEAAGGAWIIQAHGWSAQVVTYGDTVRRFVREAQEPCMPPVTWRSVDVNLRPCAWPVVDDANGGG